MRLTQDIVDDWLKTRSGKQWDAGDWMEKEGIDPAVLALIFDTGASAAPKWRGDKERSGAMMCSAFSWGWQLANLTHE